MPELTLKQIMDWSGAALISGDACDPQTVISGVCSDTRQLRPGALFIALRGDRFDGHTFIGRAFELSAGAIMIDSRQAFSDLQQDEQNGVCSGFCGHIPVLLVRDTLQALQDLAAGYRQLLQVPVIAVTGSVGKTSTRQMIAACLAPALRVHQTEANLNNEIGLPQTLLSSEPTDQAVVLEMGMRAAGEIALLSRVANPDIAIITCIGWSHIGRLGSREAILEAKWEIVSGLRPGGLLIINGDDPLLVQAAATLSEEYRLAVVCTTSAGLSAARSLARPVACVLTAGQVSATANQTAFSVQLMLPEQPHADAAAVTLPFPGQHHIRNTLFGLAAAWALQQDLTASAGGAAACSFAGNRQRVIQAGGMTIMDDSYNASPESIAAALEALSVLAGDKGRKIAALGCMLELGLFAAEAHRQVGEQVASHGFSLLLVYGAEAEDYLIGARTLQPELPSCCCADQNEMADRLAAALRPGDFLLIKGSRAYAMEQVTDRLIKLLASSLRKETGHDLA